MTLLAVFYIKMKQNKEKQKQQADGARVRWYWRLKPPVVVSIAQQTTTQPHARYYTNNSANKNQNLQYHNEVAVEPCTRRTIQRAQYVHKFNRIIL